MTKLFVQIPAVCILVCLVLCVLSVLVLLIRRVLVNDKVGDSTITFDGVDPIPYNPSLSEAFIATRISPTFDVSRLNKEEIADLEKLLGCKIR